MLVAVWIACGIVAAIIASAKHHDLVPAFALGVVLGPFGVLIELVQKAALPVAFACPVAGPLGERCVLASGHEGAHRAN